MHRFYRRIVGPLCMYDGDVKLQIGAEDARRAFEESSDRSTVVTFAPEPGRVALDTPRFKLWHLRGA